MLTLDEVNALCVSIATETADEAIERIYSDYMEAKLAEAEAMEYAANSYDADAISYSI
jgi:UDP-glucose 6-dehydrogenase